MINVLFNTFGFCGAGWFTSCSLGSSTVPTSRDAASVKSISYMKYLHNLPNTSVILHYSDTLHPSGCSVESLMKQMVRKQLACGRLTQTVPHTDCPSHRLSLTQTVPHTDCPSHRLSLQPDSGAAECDGVTLIRAQVHRDYMKRRTIPAAQGFLISCTASLDARSSSPVRSQHIRGPEHNGAPAVYSLPISLQQFAEKRLMKRKQPSASGQTPALSIYHLLK